MRRFVSVCRHRRNSTSSATPTWKPPILLSANGFRVDRRWWTPPLSPFLEAGALLYSGPWVAERLVEFADFLAKQPDSIHPVVRDILRSGERYTAVDAFAAQQKLQDLRAEVGRLWREMDVLVVPTIGTTFTVAQVLERPIDCNTMLGHYTHFGNLLDLTGVAVPVGHTGDGRPLSVTIIGPALSDDTVLDLAAQILDEPRDVSSIAQPHQFLSTPITSHEENP